MRTDGEAGLERPGTMFVQGRVRGGDGGLKECVRFAGGEQGAFEKTDRLIQHGTVARNGNVMCCHMRQPHPVIRYAGADAAARIGQPPMLHVAFSELARRGAQQMRPAFARAGHAERHDVLQLVGESHRRHWPGRTPTLPTGGMTGSGKATSGSA